MTAAQVALDQVEVCPDDLEPLFDSKVDHWGDTLDIGDELTVADKSGNGCIHIDQLPTYLEDMKTFYEKVQIKAAEEIAAALQDPGSSCLSSLPPGSMLTTTPSVMTGGNASGSGYTCLNSKTGEPIGQLQAD